MSVAAALKRGQSADVMRSVSTIVQELDAADWQVCKDRADVSVSARYGASGAPVIGFKTRTFHSAPFDALVGLLGDVIDAMGEINEQFVHGDVLGTWPIEADPSGRLVRTAFSMPWPMKGREFVHGLHVVPLDDDTSIIAYTPVEVPEIATLPGYSRCKMYVSGQRVQRCEDGTVLVEHLMVYELGGRISRRLQDSWLMRAAHVQAYIKEWRALRNRTRELEVDGLEPERLKRIARHSLEQAETWPVARSAGCGQIRAGRLAHSLREALYTQLDVEAPIERVVEVLADRSLHYLPQWNAEYRSGEVLQTLEESPKTAAWIVRVLYGTPSIIRDREYVYWFFREWLSRDEVLVLYHSVNADAATVPGALRACLGLTVHRLRRLPGGGTRIEHILATDLCGRMGPLQDRWLRPELLKAHRRDMARQAELLTHDAAGTTMPDAAKTHRLANDNHLWSAPKAAASHSAVLDAGTSVGPCSRVDLQEPRLSAR